MGMRSMNALVVAGGFRLTPDAVKALDAVSAVVKASDGSTLWSWETNIAPFWARTSALDLREEVAIFEGVAQLPPAAYRWLRADEDPGAKGNLHEHPLFADPAFVSVSQALAEDLAGAEA